MPQVCRLRALLCLELSQGMIARFMYSWLYKMHEWALHGTMKTALDTLARGLSRHAEPKVKLH